jgi:hypothetical protein
MQALCFSVAHGTPSGRPLKFANRAVERKAVRHHVATLITRFGQDVKYGIPCRLRGDGGAAELLLGADKSRYVKRGWNRMNGSCHHSAAATYHIETLLQRYRHARRLDLDQKGVRAK